MDLKLLKLCARETGITAETISVYLTLLHQAINVNATPISMPSSILSEQIRKSWLQALGTLEPEKLDRRLLWDNLDPTYLNTMLSDGDGDYSSLDLDQVACSIDTLSMDALKKICEAIKASENQPFPEQGDDAIHPEDYELAFCDLWHPAVEWSVVELRRRICSLMDVQIQDGVFTNLSYCLLERLCFVSEQALWELFEAERGIGAFILEHFRSKGDGFGLPMRDHYQRFIQRHRCDGLASLLHEFPVLGRMLGQTVVFWLDSSEEILLRVYKDRKFLQKTFDIPTDASLDSISQGLSDHHCGGRTVAILTFVDDTNSWKVAYKPRDMGLDVAFQQALVDLNNNSVLPPFLTLKVLNRQGYGYMEFVQHRICKTPQELKRFYHNAGRLSAVLYILGCTDCHHENLIASGDQLVLIDTETLLEPTVADHIRKASKSNTPKTTSELQKKFNDSVLRLGLLPSWMLVGVQKHAFDLSALGINPPTDDHELVSGWVGVNSDGMLRGCIKVPVTLPTSLPVGIGDSNPLQQHVAHYLAGFRDQSHALIQRRGDWLSPCGIFSRFIGLPRRIVLRATRVYFSIQIQQLRAEALRSEMKQGMKLEQLARLFLIAETRPKNWSVFSAEMQQMEQLDIPYFVHQIDNSKLSLRNGSSTIDDFFETSGLEASRRRLEAFDDKAVEFQICLMKGAIQAKELRAHCNLLSEIRTRTPANSLNLSASNRLHEAQNVARKLVDLSFDNGAEWIGYDLASDCDKLLFQPMGMSLYSGTIGIAAFFACLKKSQNHSRRLPKVKGLERMVQQILQPLTELTNQTSDGALMRWWRDQPIGLGGSAGQLLTLIAMDEINVVPDGCMSGRALACQLLEGLRESFVLSDTEFDLISGATGLIGPLLLLDTNKSGRLAKLIGDRLVETQQESGEWVGSDSKSTPFQLGFSNGMSGIVAALAQLYRHTGSPHYRNAVLRAMVFERKQCNVEMDNWLAPHDHCKSGASNKLIGSCCHGVSGAVLGRLCLMGTDLWDNRVEQEISAMIEVLGRTAFPVGPLCCGSIGHIAIVRLAHQRLGNEMWREISDQIEASSLHRDLKKDGQLGFSDEQERSLIQLGFMNGLSGIGLVLLDDEYSQLMIQTLLSAGLLVDSPSG